MIAAILETIYEQLLDQLLVRGFISRENYIEAIEHFCRTNIEDKNRDYPDTKNDEQETLSSGQEVRETNSFEKTADGDCLRSKKESLFAPV